MLPFDPDIKLYSQNLFKSGKFSKGIQTFNVIIELYIQDQWPGLLFRRYKYFLMCIFFKLKIKPKSLLEEKNDEQSK